MTPVNVFFMLTLFFSGGHIEIYDAQFETFEECYRMGNFHMTGINGPVNGYRCVLTVEG